MTTEGDGLAAACGRCGESEDEPCLCAEKGRHEVHICEWAAAGYHPCIPAPVVPSDERCSTCDRREREDCPQCEFDIHREAPGIGACQKHHPFSYPPTPSQDAEGDGWRWGDGKATRLGEAVGIAQWRVSYKPGQRGYDFDTGTAYHNVPVEVESAIREPYEALVKALLTSSIAQSVLTNFKSRGVSGVCDVLERDWGSDESDVAEFCTILARIEESLGGSKDG